MRIEGIPYEFNPDIRHPGYLTRRGLLEALARHSPALEGRLMDFGCGSKPYKILFSVNEYIGVDFQGEGHSHENEQIDVFYNGKTLPFPNEHFDSVFSSEVFEHIFNLEEILSEINRVLKPGGKILITCPFCICEHEVPNDFARYTSFGIQHLMNKHGFRILKYEKLGSYVETVMQLRITYIHQHILPFFRKIPVVRSGLRLLVYSSFNLWALLKSRLLPYRQDLYLTNVVLCEKQ